MIGTHVISLPTKLPYYLYEDNRWDSKRPFLETKYLTYLLSHIKELEHAFRMYAPHLFSTLKQSLFEAS